MSVILSLLTYAKFISLRTPGSIASSMWWSKDQLTYFIKGCLVILQQLSKIVQEIVVEAERLL
jgi:hypothetical protein